MSNWQSILSLAIAIQGTIFALLSCSQACADDAAPNVVLILADDLGWTDLACQGSQYYSTPNLDQLAATGLRMSCFYVCQNCAPTRASLMTGQYSPRTGIFTVNQSARGQAEFRRLIPPKNVVKLPLDRKTMADVLHEAGYSTGMFGKWHLGNEGEFHPSKRGFDEAIVSQGKHFDFSTIPDTGIHSEKYLADWITDQALDFISRHQHQRFFLYVPHFAVHSPIQAKTEDIKRFQSKSPRGGHRNPTYAAMIYSVDESVGRIIDHLQKLNLRENTLVIFLSDNGGVGGYDSGIGGGAITDNKPLRGGKGTLYEGGIRVPLIVNWPSAVPPGVQIDTPAAHVDLLPTLAAIAGAPLPDEQALDGVNLAPLWRDPSKTIASRSLYWHMPGYLEGNVKRGTWRTTPVSVIRRDRYKLLHFYEDDRVELYDLQNDLGETTNLRDRNPEIARQLDAELHHWRTELKAAEPRPKGLE